VRYAVAQAHFVVTTVDVERDAPRSFREHRLGNPDGSYRAPPHDVTGHTWQHDDTRLIQIVKLGGSRVSPEQGASNMPGYANVLSDVEIAAVLAYIKSSWPPEVQQVQWEVTMRH
jgi:hypothetical protein